MEYYRVRRARAADRSRLSAFAVAADAGDGWGGVWPEAMHRATGSQEDGMAALFADPAVLVVAESSYGGTVGAACVAPGERPGTSHAGTAWFGVLGPWRGLGVGTALLREAIRLAESGPLERLSASAVAGDRAALSLYSAAGFSRSGRVTGGLYAGGERHDVVLLERGLHGEW